MGFDKLLGNDQLKENLRAALERAAAFGDTIWAGREAARLLRDMAQGEG